MKTEISDVVNKEPYTLKEKIGIELIYLTCLPVIPYIYNRLVTKLLGLNEILTPIADCAGNVPHIFVAYYGGLVLEKLFNNEKITNISIGLATTYHVLGEIFHSSIAPNLPQILPGTPDIQDVPLTITIALGLYLANKNI